MSRGENDQRGLDDKNAKLRRVGYMGAHFYIFILLSSLNR